MHFNTLSRRFFTFETKSLVIYTIYCVSLHCCNVLPVSRRSFGILQDLRRQHQAVWSYLLPTAFFTAENATHFDFSAFVTLKYAHLRNQSWSTYLKSITPHYISFQSIDENFRSASQIQFLKGSYSIIRYINSRTYCILRTMTTNCSEYSVISCLNPYIQIYVISCYRCFWKHKVLSLIHHNRYFKRVVFHRSLLIKIEQ